MTEQPKHGDCVYEMKMVLIKFSQCGGVIRKFPAGTYTVVESDVQMDSHANFT